MATFLPHPLLADMQRLAGVRLSADPVYHGAVDLGAARWAVVADSRLMFALRTRDASVPPLVAEGPWGFRRYAHAAAVRSMGLLLGAADGAAVPLGPLRRAVPTHARGFRRRWCVVEVAGAAGGRRHHVDVVYLRALHALEDAAAAWMWAETAPALVLSGSVNGTAARLAVAACCPGHDEEPFSVVGSLTAEVRD